MAPAEIAPVLYTSRLTLTSFSWSNPADAAVIIAAMTDPVALEKQGDVNIRNPDDIRRWERGTCLSTSTLTKAYKRSGRPVPPEGLSPPPLPWYIIHLGANSPNGTPIGVITTMECQPPVPHIGWALCSAYHNRGYATEAAREVLRYWQEDFGIDVVMAITDLENYGSYHLAEKLGMKPHPRGLRWRGAGLRTLANGASSDVMMRCYLTAGADEFPEGTEFELFRKEGESV